MIFSIPKAAMLDLWNDYNRSSIFFMCRQMITHKLLMNGIDFEKNKKSFTPSLEIQDAVNEYWFLFVESFVDQVIAFGFALVTILEDAAKRKYPQIVNPKLVNISVEIASGKRTFMIESNEIDPDNILIYDQFGFHSHVHGGIGMIASLAWKVNPYIKFLRNMRGDCAQMENNKSNPQFFSEVTETSRERQEGVDFDYYADADASEISEEMQYTRNKVNLEILNKQKELYDEQMGNGRAVTKLENVVQLPSGHTIKPTPQNTGRQDIVQIHKVVQEVVCTTLGVPRAMLVADGQYSSSTEGVEMLFESTLTWWRKQVESTITDLYTKIYFTKTKLQKNIYLAKQRQQVKLILPATIDVDIDKLTLAYDMGVINWETYSSHIVKQLRLPEQGRNKTAPLQNVNTSEVVSMSNKRKRAGGGSDAGTVE
jgi:hypothetical protein